MPKGKKPLPGFRSIGEIIVARDYERQQSLANSGSRYDRFMGLTIDGKKFAAPERLSVHESFFYDELYLALHDRVNWQNVHDQTQRFTAVFIEKCRKMGIPMHAPNATHRGVQIAHSVVGCGYTQQENLFLWHVFKEVQRKLPFTVSPVKAFGSFGLFYLPELPHEALPWEKGTLRLTPRAMLKRTQGHS